MQLLHLEISFKNELIGSLGLVAILKVYRIPFVTEFSKVLIKCDPQVLIS